MLFTAVVHVKGEQGFKHIYDYKNSKCISTLSSILKQDNIQLNICFPYYLFLAIYRHIKSVFRCLKTDMKKKYSALCLYSALCFHTLCLSQVICQKADQNWLTELTPFVKQSACLANHTEWGNDVWLHQASPPWFELLHQLAAAYNSLVACQVYTSHEWDQHCVVTFDTTFS